MTGQIVVETGTVEVTTVTELAGQLVTVGAQLVTVTSTVVYTVDVENVVKVEVTGGDDEPGPAYDGGDGLLPGTGYVVGPAALGTDELLPGPDCTGYV